MGRKNWIYALRKEELSEVCKELGLPAKGTVENMRALVAKWVDETKDAK
ncbi:hypothetical protein KR067_008748 [Drosophila pandora]|nr:hypothetical protein KR067_008748 [Drosophila pandora]